LAQLQAHPDATLDEHCRLWAEATGQQVSVSTMCRLQQRLGLTRKKSPSAPANVTRSSVPPSGS
jgi:transposase